MTTDTTKPAPSAALEEQFEDLTREALAAMHKGDRIKAQRLFEKKNALAERIWGNGPIVGSGGRTL